ncbi:MAG: hypothetical protein Q9164_001011 [Protoblastenia rupestris]
MASKPLVESLNALPISVYRNKLLKPTFSDIKYEKKSHEISITPSLESAETLSPADFKTCFDLIAETSSADYAASSMDWSPAKKKKEMRLPDMRYLLLKSPDLAGEKGTEILGFLSFMVTYEDGYEVVYCYEIHLTLEVQGKGIGGQLMETLESIGKKAGMQKTMLTVLLANDSAQRFYERLGYKEDEFSPRPRKLRNGTVKRPDYAILSKVLKGSIRRPDHVTDKKRKTDR